MIRFYRQPMKVGEVYPTKYGDLRILQYFSKREVIVQFLWSGSMRVADVQHIRNGKVMDFFLPTVQGVGYLGVGDFKSHRDGKKDRAYSIWLGMMRRCYSAAYQKDKPTYKKCTVHSDWHNYQDFAGWYYKNYVEGYDLDKDLKVWGNTEYGPETCTFVSTKLNRGSAKDKHLKTDAFIIGKDYSTVESQLLTI